MCVDWLTSDAADGLFAGQVSHVLHIASEHNTTQRQQGRHKLVSTPSVVDCDWRMAIGDWLASSIITSTLRRLLVPSVVRCAVYCVLVAVCWLLSAVVPRTCR